jgi:hypothetical protein
MAAHVEPRKPVQEPIRPATPYFQVNIRRLLDYLPEDFMPIVVQRTGDHDVAAVHFTIARRELIGRCILGLHASGK